MLKICAFLYFWSRSENVRLWSQPKNMPVWSREKICVLLISLRKYALFGTLVSFGCKVQDDYDRATRTWEHWVVSRGRSQVPVTDCRAWGQARITFDLVEKICTFDIGKKKSTFVHTKKYALTTSLEKYALLILMKKYALLIPRKNMHFCSRWTNMHFQSWRKKMHSLVLVKKYALLIPRKNGVGPVPEGWRCV